MLQGFLSKLAGKIKTTRRRTPIDCRDFFEVAPLAPEHKRIQEAVAERLFSKKPPPASPAEQEQRDYALRATVFDLQYRCGAGGRCICANDGTAKVPACRFPSCFALRPITKGAEILAERNAYEVLETPNEEVKALVKLALQDRLEDCQLGIQQLVSRRLAQHCGGKALSSEFQVSDNDFNPAKPYIGSDSPLAGGHNPLKANEELREEVVSLYLWRAALLVNLRRDDAAVNSLLNLANLVENESRLKLLTAAAGWATMNDMEIIFWRSFIQQFDSNPTAEEWAEKRDTLLRRVVESCRGEAYFVENCTHMAFAKEITALVSRAQASQVHRDASEDPMTTFCIPFALRYYRFFVSDAFWATFFDLLVMPPSPPPPEDATDPMKELNLTPPHVLDAIGRSIMLHHLLMLHDGRERERDSGALNGLADAAKKDPTMFDHSQLDHYLDGRQAVIASSRLRELLSLIKSNDPAAIGGAAPGKQIANEPSAAPATTDKPKP